MTSKIHFTQVLAETATRSSIDCMETPYRYSSLPSLYISGPTTIQNGFPDESVPPYNMVTVHSPTSAHLWDWATVNFRP